MYFADNKSWIDHIVVIINNDNSCSPLSKQHLNDCLNFGGWGSQLYPLITADDSIIIIIIITTNNNVIIGGDDDDDDDNDDDNKILFQVLRSWWS